jgi:hypothetical protein
MAQQEYGKMDITEQQKTFDGFIRMSVRVTIVVIVTLVFIALVNG